MPPPSADPNLDTLLCQSLHYIDPSTGGLTPPIQPSTTFARDSEHNLASSFSYSRFRNPVCDVVESLCARLDAGADALAFSSGMAAIITVFDTVELGAHVVAPRTMYHGAQDWLRRLSEKRRIRLSLFDACEKGALERAVEQDKTKILWIESPVNPTWDIIDIAAAAEAVHAVGGRLIVDATVATPLTTRALEHGADMVFHSATKYYNGHSDVSSGILVTKSIDETWEEIRQIRTSMGNILPSFEGWLLLRGMRTLSVRFHRACENASAIAHHFHGHPKVERVLYPGLKCHPGHEVAARQMLNGFGGMVSILVKGGWDEARTVVTGTKVFICATSLGGVESLIEHRAAVQSARCVVAQNLVRLSVGIEHKNDLIDDLEQSLSRI